MWSIAWVMVGCGVSDPHVGLDLDDPQSCATCHAPLVDEWHQSMHARAHASKDPVFAALRDLREKKQGPEVVAKCARCHTPRSDDQDSAAARAGVSCAACHVEPDGGVGMVAEGSELCLTCHEATTTPGGAAACTTGPEHAAMGGVSCQSCHMPTVEGPGGTASDDPTHASHAFLGPHRAYLQDDRSFLAQAVAVSIAATSGGATVTLVNAAGHGFPTGFPGREAILSITVRSRDGAPVHTESHRLGKRYVDAEGVPVPAAFATTLEADTRLRPAEQRGFDVAVPEGARRIEARLEYRLLPATLGTRLGLADAPEAAPVLLAREVLVLDSAAQSSDPERPVDPR